MACIVANAVATNAFNQQKFKTPRKVLASAAKKEPEPRFGERPEVREAFSNIKKNPAMAETQFRALLKACGNCEKSINTLTEGLARAIMRQGKPRCAEAEGILRELLTKFTRTTPHKLLQAVNLTLANALINQGKYSQAQSLLLQTMELVDPERADMDEQTALVTACGQQRIDQAMVQAHLGKSHHHKARTLLLSIMKDLRPPEQHHLSEEELVHTLCGDNELDVIMSRILEKQHHFAAAQALLLAIMEQCPVKRQQRLPSNPVSPLPCADQTLNMNLFRLLSESDNDQQARLFILQTMAMKEPARYQLGEDQALLTPCNDQKLNLALVRHLQKEGNRTAAIQLLTAIMHAPGQLTPAITPCDNNDLNFSMFKLLEEEHRLAEAETFLLQVMNTYRPKNQRSLPAALAITTPCGCDTWDLAMFRLLINRKSLPEAEAMMRRIVAQHRPEHQRTLSPTVVDAIPCGNGKLDLQMAKVFCHRHKYKLAESLLLALMNIFRPHSDLPREKALITACGHNETDLAMVFLQEERGNFDTAISLMLSSMAGHRPRWQRELSPEQAMQTPCLRHEHNMTLLRLLGKAGKEEATRQLLLAIMALNRAHNHADLSPDDALSTPCGYSEVDRTAAITLLELNEQEKSVNLVLAMMQAHRPEQQKTLPRDQAMTTPCPVPSLNQLLFTTLAYRDDTHPAAEKLMLTMMKSYPLNPRRTIPEDQLKFTPCSNYTMNMSMIMLLSKKGDIAGAKQLLLATMSIYRPHDQRSLPDHLAQITPCHKHDLDLKMVIILENEKQYQQARLMLLAMMKIDPTATATAHGPCGSPLLDTAMLRLLAADGPEDQHNELITACLKRYPEDPSFLIHHLINLCRQHKWADYDQQIGRLRPSIQRELSISIRFFTEALHCYLAGNQSKGKELCTRAYGIADRALQKSPRNSSLLSHKAHCARILGHPSGEYLPLFDQARMLDPNRERTEKIDHWRSDENRVIELLGV